MSEKQRFGGISRLYGVDGTEKLAAAHVCLTGVGGVGAWSAEALARSGAQALSLGGAGGAPTQPLQPEDERRKPSGLLSEPAVPPSPQPRLLRTRHTPASLASARERFLERKRRRGLLQAR